LEQLPGVGRKTANVILNTAFSKPTIAVDTHVFRVANRTGLAKGETPIKVEHGLLSVIPKKYLINAHHHLILHGRYVCLARKPLCYKCHITNHCAFKEKTCEPN
jgi:endonuclease-3